MNRELDYSKCIALLRKLLRENHITENEYIGAKRIIMSRFMILENEKAS